MYRLSHVLSLDRNGKKVQMDDDGDDKVVVVVIVFSFTYISDDDIGGLSQESWIMPIACLLVDVDCVCGKQNYVQGLIWSKEII